MYPFPLTTKQNEVIFENEIKLKTFQETLGQMYVHSSTNESANLLKLTRFRSDNSYYYELTPRQQIWLTAQHVEMLTMQSNHTPLTKKYCAQLFVDYSEAIPQLDPIENLLDTLRILLRSVRNLGPFNQMAINLCIQRYPKLTFNLTQPYHQEMQMLKNNLLGLLTGPTILNHSQIVAIDQKIVWFAQFPENMGIMASECDFSTPGGLKFKLNTGK